LFNYFDILVVSLALTFNFIAWKYIKLKKLGVLIPLVIVILFCFVLPPISKEIELHQAIVKYPNSEGFNLFYIEFISPLYFIYGTIEFFILYLISRYNKNIKKSRPVKRSGFRFFKLY
jgi:hypothetical protein